MNTVRFCLFAGLVILLAAGCQHDPVSSPSALPETDLAPAGFDAELAAGEIVTMSGWEFAPDLALPDRVTSRDPKCLNWILDWSREVLAGGVVHYEYLVQVGPGEHDRIMVHRVVKESRPYRPINSRHAFFMLHGDAVGWVKFLYGHAAPNVPDDHAAAIYLAQHDVDVWGIDQNWVLVPEDTADFGFMQDWGMDNQLANLNAGLAVARYTRLFTGCGFRKMLLLGYSSGALTGYAYINAEATIPYGQRHVKGYVAADILYKFEPGDAVHREVVCNDVTFLRGLLDAGEYGYAPGFEAIGELAANDPDSDSPIFPGYTNRQVALIIGGATWTTFPFNDWWHYFGAYFDPDTGLPTDFRFLDFAWVTDFMRLGCPWEALRFIYDTEVIICDEEDVTWDDNLALVDLPILLLEPAGGIGATGRYTLGLFTNADTEILTVSLLPPEQITEDVGHIDIWTMPQAPELVWAPLLDWIVSHPGRDADDEYPLVAGME
ncbi:MAG TPA: hypothetical protein PLL30_14305 [Candidatus Krumholzibacteria bacterium]|nr:hypothetical protein [Candidatus Krumholzibacteria bacterium]HPD72939.1 hypothetical protein [Candidatus Krumholzibacteria bacterium]HRY41738.1 hypothetical protein [Candidatus Krumholzibacteria bacterium]